MDTRSAAAATSGLGSRIQHRRLALGLSTAEVAERTGLSARRIEHIETRPFVLTGAELVQLAHALDSTVDDLTGPHTPFGVRRAPLTPVLQPMRRDECLALVEAADVGRIAYRGADELVVIPVNYCYHDNLILFRTAADSAVAQYDLEPIAFELDSFDEGMHDGWSVLINGKVRPATDLESDAAYGRVEPWAGGRRDTCLAIEPHQITGRRIRSW
ncbi:pyridoxamine 5'-phosphate oxidase family protein [Kribbella sp. NPDC026611]|uniref:helix-turn-helix domain-containing protein n=1 Tax=Kribbella sp. NPDC026611 TaxID=3154911 RepID=UPI00340E1AB4